LFLDEVGDIQPELQPKLLRVLQEQEFERLGSAKTIRVNVRLIAATHRDLNRLVAAGTFRSDLFYRLRVFPIRLPPLRELRADIPALVRHFTVHFARRIGKEIDIIPEETLAALQNYDWPGNVRELEHLVERAVILSPGRDLRVPLSDLSLVPTAAVAVPSRPSGGNALEDAEREMIRRTLEECRWVVGGAKGAAARLGIKRTTLLARMKKFGLRRSPPQNMSRN
jgi:formate hydrogenlyase transcriptional activator